MIRNLSIKILVDNKSGNEMLHSEHGLSFWIEADERRIVFDTGKSDILIGNAEVLGIDLRTAGTMILSHGHYDHTGGVAAVRGLNPEISVYCHPGIFIPRYSRQTDGKMKPIGINENASNELHKMIDRIHWINEPFYLSDDIGITGPIPRLSDFEDTGGSFFLDPEAQRPDPISDDLALWFKTTKGIVVVTGCCHSGIVNTLEYIQTITGDKNILTVLGGLHLLNASLERLEKSCEYLNRAVSGKIYPCHCTGDKAIGFLRTRFHDRIIVGNVGASFQF
ncbi:MAG: MBL fold metallo-hydrolase [Chitinispirillaceae bacterium]|nr:MBL fold metallo-hydrolase [Chitinispirillaceae bacterium]